MSRIGKQPVPVPSGVDLKIDGQRVTVKGPQGELRREFPDRVKIEMVDGEALVTRFDDERQSRALHGLARALLANMVTGVSEGYQKSLSIVGVGYRASAAGKGIELQVGFSHSVQVDAPDGITLEVPDPTNVLVKGIDKELVGQVAANIRKIRPPEPYKGKGIRYTGEHVRRKAGKAGVASG
ncbi:MAG: 50S ribosomal protein L6 [Acidimicrobiia bacterium]|nr:50S ribosomal protein L6 [Acidimicrobiia bacterium]